MGGGPGEGLASASLGLAAREGVVPGAVLRYVGKGEGGGEGSDGGGVQAFVTPGQPPRWHGLRSRTCFCWGRSGVIRQQLGSARTNGERQREREK